MDLGAAYLHVGQGQKKNKKHAVVSVFTERGVETGDCLRVFDFAVKSVC